MIKNVFYFILKALLALKIFKSFSLIFLVRWVNGLIRKLTLLSKFMTLQPGTQTIAVHMSKISRSNHSQAIEIGQLIGHKVRNKFL